MNNNRRLPKLPSLENSPIARASKARQLEIHSQRSFGSGPEPRLMAWLLVAGEVCLVAGEVYLVGTLLRLIA